MAVVKIADLQMHIDVVGPRDGLPVVLLHGFTGTGQDWRPQIDSLAAKYRVIVPDLRGHGRSDNPAGRSAMNHRQFARDIEAMCDQLDITRGIFFGESTGSMLQLSLAIARPDLVAASVLAAATFYWSAELRTSMASHTPDELARTWFPDPAAFEAFRAAHTALGPDHWRMVIGDFIAVFSHDHAQDFPLESELASIEAPVLIVHGDRDHHFAPEVACRLYRLLPRAELCVLPNTGHWPPAEQPAAFNLLTTQFLDRVLGVATGLA
jgi:pimeloyl-ACP methyl ester carboxylesterase